MMAAFTGTRITMAGHINWEFLLAGVNTVQRDWEDERDILDDMRTQYGGRLVLEEHGLKASRDCTGRPSNEDPAAAGTWYCFLWDIGRLNQTAPAASRTPFGFQFNDVTAATFDNAKMVRDYGACNLESWSFGYLAESEREMLDPQYEANCN